MTKLISINRDDRTQERIQQRSADEATDELRQCITSMNASLEMLARSFPGCIGIGAIVAGWSTDAMVLTTSREGDMCSRVAMDRMRTLGRIIGNMSPEFVSAFQAGFNFVRETNRIQAEAEKARADALAATDKAQAQGE